MKILILLFLILFFPLVFAQVALQPAEVNFTVTTIILEPLATTEDFTGTSQILGLQGDLNYLNIRWNARYYTEEERDIGVWCYLNCPNVSSPIQVNCKDYQNCTYLGPTGEHSCSISFPNYLFTQINNVTCKFYDPENPEIEYLPYPNRTFYPIKFDLSAEPATITLGEPFTLSINVKSFGLLISNFTVNTSLIPSPEAPPVIIENPLASTESIVYGQTGSVFPKITFLATGKATFEIYSKSNIEPVPNFDTSCNLREDCQFFDLGYGYDCIDQRCWARYELQINAGKKSLSEFEIFGFIQILLITTILLILKKEFSSGP
jgi:hypothetical protein